MAVSSSTDPSEITEAALIEIFSNWQAKRDEVTQHFKNGFDWLPGSHMVLLRCNQREGDGGNMQFRVAVTTEYLRTVPIEDQKFVRRSALLADKLWPTCAPVYRPLRHEQSLGEMHLTSSMYFEEESALVLSTLLARLTILQPVYAEQQSSTAPEMLGGGFAAVGGRKDRRNSALECAEKTIYPQAARPSRWIGSAEFEQFALERKGSDFCQVSASTDGMILEIPFGVDTVMTAFRTDQPHPQLGNGLSITSAVEFFPDVDMACTEAARLNLLEASNWTEIPQLGCWYVRQAAEGQYGLAHHCFIPNACFMPELVAVLANWALERVWWARTVLRPSEADVLLGQRRNGPA